MVPNGGSFGATERVMTVAETFSAEVLRTLTERAGWYRDGCPHLEDGGAYLREGDVAKDAASDLTQALDIIASLAREVETLKAKLAEATEALRKDIAEEVDREQAKYDAGMGAGLSLAEATIARLTAENQRLERER